MNDIIRYEQWKYLPVEDIIRQCRTNKLMNKVCNDPETWRYLLRRDFNVDDEKRDTYQRYKDEYYNRKLTEWENDMKQQLILHKMIDLTILYRKLTGVYPRMMRKSEVVDDIISNTYLLGRDRYKMNFDQLRNAIVSYKYQV